VVIADHTAWHNASRRKKHEISLQGYSNLLYPSTHTRQNALDSFHENMSHLLISGYRAFQAIFAVAEICIGNKQSNKQKIGALY